MPFEKVSQIYSKYFSMGFLNCNLDRKLAMISLTCYITSELRKKGKKATCYDVLLKIGQDMPDLVKNTFLKSLGAICEDFMYSCTDFPTFDIKPSDMPKTVRKLMDNYCPF